MYKLKLTLEKKHRLLIFKKSHRDKVISVINIASPEELQRPAISIYMQYYARLGHWPTRKNSHPSKKITKPYFLMNKTFPKNGLTNKQLRAIANYLVGRDPQAVQ
jgi:hypothetical protein